MFNLLSLNAFSGLTIITAAQEQPWSQDLEDLCASGVNLWSATRALNAGPKIYKEIARGVSIADLDRKKSFPNAVLDRYPDLDAVEMWVTAPANFAAACDFDVSDEIQYKQVKDFCNSAAGSGKTFEAEWLKQVGRDELPGPMVLYREQLRTAATRDVDNRPELVKAFGDAGVRKEDIANKVHYVCNAEIERKESDEAIARRVDLAETVAFESDGHPCRIMKPRTDTLTVLNAMNNGLVDRKQFVLKPYRGKEQLLADLMAKYPEVPRDLFTSVDPAWKDKAAKMIEFKRRLAAGENPVMLSKLLVPDFSVDGRTVRDQLRTVLGSKDQLDYVRFLNLAGGGYWTHEHRKIGEAWLKQRCMDFCIQADGCAPDRARARVKWTAIVVVLHPESSPLSI